MPRKPEPLEPWVLEGISLIIRQNLTLRQAALQLGQEISAQEADNIKGRIRFQEALEEARLTYYSEIGANPKLSKEVIVGKLYKLAERLADDHEDYKAADTMLKLAKVQGWVGAEPDSLCNTFAKLSQADIDEVKRQLKEQIEQQGQPPLETPPTESEPAVN